MSEAGAQGTAGAPSSEEGPCESVRINQVYRNCLDAHFRQEYFREIHADTLKQARRFDFLIAAGTLATGGSGMGILSDPMFAWACGIMTSVSLLLSAAKSVYDWPGKVKASLARVEHYSSQHAAYAALVEDIQYRRAWNADFETRFDRARKAAVPQKAFEYPHLIEARQRSIQERIKKQVAYEKWWKFER